MRNVAQKLASVDPSVAKISRTVGGGWKGFISAEASQTVERGHIPELSSINEAVVPVFEEIQQRALHYSGLNPSASNCRLHSVGGSRSRSMPVPRGRRPSTAALTRLGARKASEMLIFTWRALHSWFTWRALHSWRMQSWATVVTRPETTSSSH
jgi:hypothetical protein